MTRTEEIYLGDTNETDAMMERCMRTFHSLTPVERIIFTVFGEKLLSESRGFKHE